MLIDLDHYMRSIDAQTFSGNQWLNTLLHKLIDANSYPNSSVSVLSLQETFVSLVSMVIDSNDYALVFAIDKGAALAKGAGTTAADVVGGNESFVAGDMTDDAWALYDAAIAWMGQ